MTTGKVEFGNQLGGGGRSQNQTKENVCSNLHLPQLVDKRVTFVAEPVEFITRD